jgi:uncharacterized repeat protein (TIGR03803 family)
MFLMIVYVATTIAQAQTFSVLYNFGTNSGDPIPSQFSQFLAQGRNGDLYSATGLGGTFANGTTYKVTPAGTLTALHNFDGQEDGDTPYGLTMGTDGNFYGTTPGGGTSKYGTVFKMTASGTLNELYNFAGSTDGGHPAAPPIQGTDGNFYGMTSYGALGYGTVYKITPTGRLTTLYQFDSYQGLVVFPPLIQASDGNLYGTTSGYYGGNGSVFKITIAGKFTVLYYFDGTHGAQPDAPLVQGSDGKFYGTTSGGGAYGQGTVYQITPSGSLTVLHNINGTTDGGSPWAGLLQATDGDFYGVNTVAGATNNGTIFKITPTGNFSVLHNFDGTTGSEPSVTLFQHTNGILYGVADIGGNAACGCGVFYSLNLGLKPFVSLLPISARVGKTIEILGQGFKGTTAVSFNGTPSTFKVVSSTYLTAVVPKGATTGFVTVTTPKSKLKSNQKFRIIS